MGLLGEIGKALLSEIEDSFTDKWKIFPFCSGTTGTKNVVKLLSKWDEIFQRDNFFQDMEMFPIDRWAVVYDKSGGCFIPDPNNSKEFKEMPGPQNVFHPSDGWACKLKNGGTIFIAIKDWVKHHDCTEVRDYEDFIADNKDNFDGIYEQFLGSYQWMIDGFHNIGRYKNEFVCTIFRTYYLYYKPNQNDDKYLTFLVTTGDCCYYKDVVDGKVVTTYLHSEYERFITGLKGWYDPPASMYVGYSDGSSSIHGYLTALRYDEKYLTSSHKGEPYGNVESCDQFFELLSKEEWIQEIDVEALYQHLVEFTKPICQEIERVNTIDLQKFQDAKKRGQEEKEAEEQRLEAEAQRLEEEKRKQEDSLRDSLDTI